MNKIPVPLEMVSRPGVVCFVLKSILSKDTTELKLNLFF
jgi:hypothetical protein